MYSIIVLNPLVGWLLVSLFGSVMGTSGSAYLISLLGLITFLFSCIALLDVGVLSNLMVSKYWVWMMVWGVNIEFGLLWDSVTVVMLVVVSGVSVLVYLYSIDYMAGDRHTSSFLSYLSLFSFFMVVLVTAPTYLQMFIGWEGVGLASYLLINFWSSSVLANSASFKAIIFNSVGDYGLSLAMCLIQINFGSVTYSLVNSIVPHVAAVKLEPVVFIGILLFIAACGKSAQLGLHFWLPDAMEGPTPVSALIHAATMVTAGVYVVISSSRLLEFTPLVLIMTTLVGGATAIFSSLIGVMQSDMKKVIAFSTCSQLGYMMLSCGLSLYDVGLFHLVTHAMFKALLFLSAGNIIHSMFDEQSLLSYGALISWLPWTYTCVLVASLSLGGTRFLSGFYSKDTILELVSTNSESSVTLLWCIDTFAAALTAVYSASTTILVFLVKPSGSYIDYLGGVLEGANLVGVVFVPLCLFSIMLGYLGSRMLIGEGGAFWGNAMFASPYNVNPFLDHHWMGQGAKLLPNVAAFTLMLLSIWLLIQSTTSYGLALHLEVDMFKGLVSSFHLDTFTSYLATYILYLSYSVTYQLIDKGLLEAVGPVGAPFSLGNLSSQFKVLSGGYIFSSVFWVFTLLLGSVVMEIM